MDALAPWVCIPFLRKLRHQHPITKRLLKEMPYLVSNANFTNTPTVIRNLTVLGYHLALNTKMKLLTCELGQVNSIMQIRKPYMAA